MEKGKRITIDKLAGMMKNSFDNLANKIDNVGSGVTGLKEEVSEVKDRLGKVEYRLDVIEGKLVNNHENRICKLEDDLRIIKTSSKK